MLIFALTYCTFAVSISEKFSLPKVSQITIVICDALTLQSLMQMGEPMKMLLQSSAVGLLSGSSLELRGRKGVFVTLGSGKRAKAKEKADLGKWLQQNDKSFSLVGNGILEAIVGVKAYSKAKLIRQPDVTFVAATKASLLPTLENFLKRLSENSCLWLIVPNSPQTDWSTRHLTPILVFGKKVPYGLLTSTTTRKIGLVSSVDFTPTLLAQLGIEKPATVTGSEIKVVSFEGDRLAYLKWLDERSIRPLKDLKALVVVIVLIVAIAVAFTGYLVKLYLKGMRNLFSIFAPMTTFVILAGMSIPVSLFFVGQLPSQSGVTSALQLLICISLLSMLALWSAKRIDKIAGSLFPVSLRAASLICALSAFVALFGVPLYWATPLGHYPTTGWRYFGITNSGIGIVLVGTIFSWQLLNLPSRFVAVWLATGTLLMGFSLWGANFGGALTLAFGFAVAWQLLARQVRSWQKIAVSIVGAVLLTSLFLFAIESFVPTGQKSHIGQLLQRVEFVGISALTEAVQRKLMILLEFFLRTPLNFFILLTFVAFHYAVAYLAKGFDLFAQLKSAFVATFVGAWSGLFLNDSGIEVVGMALVNIGGMFLLVLIESIRLIVNQR
ncbi:MAG: hypothetical protein NZ937_00755 [Armatimonadetes bacterium]|nr:hypothetical protein [Armatimonadota bacterium]